MSDDRFNFDDDLPDWLKGDADSDSDDDNGAEEANFDWQSTDDSGEKPDPSRLGVTGELPWRQGVSDPDDPRAPQQRPASGLDEVDWDTLAEEGDTADDSAEEALSSADVPDWLAGISDDDDTLIEEAEDVPDILQPQPESTAPAGAPVSQFEELEDDDSALPEPDITAMPDWLVNAAAEDDSEVVVEDDDDLFSEAFSSAVEEAEDTLDEDSSLGLRRVASDNPQIRKLGDKGEVNPEDMTYEEWERFQQQQEDAVERADEIELESEVPDWFRDNVEIGDAERTLDSLLLPDLDDDDLAAEEEAPPQTPDEPVTDDNFVPEWFLGLEEQNLDESPEWVREATSKTDISGLTDTTAFELPAMDDIVPAEDEPQDADAAPPDFFAMAAQEEFDVSDEDVPDEFATMFAEEAEADLDELAFEGLISTEEDERDEDIDPAWMREASDDTLVASSTDDDLFDEMMSEAPSSESDEFAADWLGGVDFGDVEEDDFLATGEPAPSTGPAMSDNVDDDLFEGAESGNLDDALSDILGDAPQEDRTLARDDRAREVASQQSETDISDLFEGVDDEFLEALSSTEPLGAVGDAESRLSGAALFEGPEWVEELRPDEQVKLGAGGFEIEFDQRALSVLPESVRQLRSEAVEYMQSAPESNEAEAIEEGTLAGITGGLAPLSLSRPEEVVLASGTTITREQEKRIELLDAALEVSREEIRAVEGDDQPASEAPPRRSRRRKRRRTQLKLDRFLVAVAMLVAVVVPFISESFHFGDDPDTTALNVQQAAVLAAVDNLRPGDRVLVAFEYGPTAAGELNPLAEAVLRDVLAQQAVPVSLSTNLLGGLNGRYVLDDLATDVPLLDALERDRLVSGEDYYTLRYLSGGPIAIRSLSRNDTTAAFVFGTDSTGENTNLDIGRVEADDFALVLVVGETTDDIRNWAEQFDVASLPKYALVTTSLEPIANAYVTDEPSTGFQGYLSGYRDTYRYNALRNAAVRDTAPPSTEIDMPDTELSQWHSLALGALSAALIIVLGVLFNLLRSLVRGRRA